MFELVKKLFIVLLSFGGSIFSMVNGSKLTTCVYLNKQPCMTRRTVIDLNPDII